MRICGAIARGYYFSQAATIQIQLVLLGDQID
jgi:hypothetical protein